MQVKCEYCDSYYDDDEEKCPYCGATNEHLNRTAKGEPRTIEELKEYCIRHNIPTARLRIFIGQNYQGAKAYGIYRDGENVIVYKNKSDGTRAIRYDGTDESYAVNELYQKIRERIVDQAENNPDFRKDTTSSYEYRPRRRNRRLTWNKWVFIILLLAFLAAAMSSGRPRFTQTESGYEFYWGSYDYDDYGYDYDYDDYDYDDDWDDDWDDYDYDWDDWDDSYDDWDSDW